MRVEVWFRKKNSRDNNIMDPSEKNWMMSWMSLSLYASSSVVRIHKETVCCSFACFLSTLTLTVRRFFKGLSQICVFDSPVSLPLRLPFLLLSCESFAWLKFLFIAFAPTAIATHKRICPVIASLEFSITFILKKFCFCPAFVIAAFTMRFMIRIHGSMFALEAVAVLRKSNRLISLFVLSLDS